MKHALADSTAKTHSYVFSTKGLQKPNPMLAYEVEVLIWAQTVESFVYVDANSGILLDIREGALHLKSKGSGMTHYYGMVLV